MIARAGEGSVRDALSLLDQAIAHGGGRSIAADVSRRCSASPTAARIIDLFEAVMAATPPAALGEMRAQYDSGADPAAVLADLAEFTPSGDAVKVAPDARGRCGR